jgi:hypothetical protein
LDKVQLEQTSRREHLAEGTLLRKLALEGIARYRLESAIHAYSTGEIDLREAARQADVRVQRLVAELDRRGIGPGSGEHVLTSGHVGCAPAASEARVSDEFRPVGHFGRLYSPACADAPGRDLVGLVALVGWRLFPARGREHRSEYRRAICRSPRRRGNCFGR